MDDNSPPKPSEDVVFIRGVTEDGNGLAVIRKREDRLEAGAVRPLEPGKPIHGEVVRLRPRPEAPYVCDVSVEFGGHQTPDSSHGALKENPEVRGSAAAPSGEGKSPALGGHGSPRPTSKGPAQVANTTYRANWDRIWKRNGMPN